MGVAASVGPDSIELRPLRAEDAAAFARLSRRVFPEYNSSRLGQGFCTALFREYARRSDVLGFGAWRGQNLLGLIVVCHHAVEQTIQRLLVRRAFLAALLRPHLLFDKRSLQRAWRALRRTPEPTPARSSAAAPATPADIGPLWLKVLSIGVAPEARGMGLGQRLMQAACDEGYKRGFRWGWLTVAPANQAARSLYEKRGWHGDPDCSPDGSMRYWGLLQPPASALPSAS